jgi:hypothetical protein
VRQVDYLQRLCRDARSTEQKSPNPTNKVPIILEKFFEKSAIIKFHENPVGNCSIQVGGRSDRQADTTKSIVA